MGSGREGSGGTRTRVGFEEKDADDIVSPHMGTSYSPEHNKG